MLMRLQEFGAANANRFAEDTFADEAFDAIRRVVSELDTYASQRLMARRQNVKARAAAREALLKMMERISRTARVLKAEDPEFVNTFLMPVQQSAEAVLTVARTFADNVEPLAEKFKGHSFGKTFPENFKQLLQRYEQAIRGRESGKGQTAATRASIEAALLSGLSAARRLDIIVANELGDDPVALAEWQRNRRVGYRRAQPSPAPPVSPTAPVEPPSLEPPSTVVVSGEEAPAMATARATPAVTPAVPMTPAVALVAANASPPERTTVADVQDVPDDVPTGVRDEDAA
jgi:hypothetical protein